MENENNTFGGMSDKGKKTTTSSAAEDAKEIMEQDGGSRTEEKQQDGSGIVGESPRSWSRPSRPRAAKRPVEVDVGLRRRDGVHASANSTVAALLYSRDASTTVPSDANPRDTEQQLHLPPPHNEGGEGRSSPHDDESRLSGMPGTDFLIARGKDSAGSRVQKSGVKSSVGVGKLGQRFTEDMSPSSADFRRCQSDGDDAPTRYALSAGSHHLSQSQYSHHTTQQVVELGDKMDTGNQLASIRTTLANERTFLAWIRTGASLVACGIAVTKFHSEHMIAGVGCFVAGFLTCGQGVVRYYQVNKQLKRIARSAGFYTDFGRIGMRWFSFMIMLVMSICVASVMVVYFAHRPDIPSVIGMLTPYLPEQRHDVI